MHAPAVAFDAIEILGGMCRVRVSDWMESSSVRLDGDNLVSEWAHGMLFVVMRFSFIGIW